MANIYRNCVDMKLAAKTLDFKKIGRNKLFEILRNKRILGADNIPYQQYINQGLFRIDTVPWEHPSSGETRMYYKTVVTPNGLIWLEHLLIQLGFEKNPAPQHPPKKNR